LFPLLSSSLRFLLLLLLLLLLLPLTVAYPAYLLDPEGCDDKRLEVRPSSLPPSLLPALPLSFPPSVATILFASSK
jgi:hypothetical protein